jgi:hypothetical protein
MGGEELRGRGRAGVWSGGTGERVGGGDGDGAARFCMAADSALGIVAEASLPSLSQPMAFRSLHRENKKNRSRKCSSTY